MEYQETDRTGRMNVSRECTALQSVLETDSSQSGLFTVHLSLLWLGEKEGSILNTEYEQKDF